MYTVWWWLPISNDAYDSPNIYQKFKILLINILLYQLTPLSTDNSTQTANLGSKQKNQNGGGRKIVF